MKVRELIEYLESMPEHFEIVMVMDGEEREFHYMVNRGAECLLIASEEQEDKVDETFDEDDLVDFGEE